MHERSAETDNAIERLRISEERHRLLAEQANDVIWTMSLDGRITYVSPSVERLRGFTPEEAMAQSLDEILTPASQADSIAYMQGLLAALERGEQPQQFFGELEYRCRDGSTVWTSVQAVPHGDAHGVITEVIGVSRDITQRRTIEDDLRAARAEAELNRRSLEVANAVLERLAATDPLTGIGNRRVGERALADAVRDHRSEQAAPVSLLVLDIDHFKLLNDRYGHVTGDRVLIELVANLRGHLRSTDTIARWGGEEFIVLLPDCPLDGALQIAETLRATVAVNAPAVEETVTISIGVAEAAHGETATDWVRRADAALYLAKSGGRDQVRAALPADQRADVPS